MEENRKTPEYEEHNASLDPDVETTMTDDELQDAVLEDARLNRFQLFIAKMDEKQWTLAQRITGAVLGILAAVSLFWNNGGEQEEGFSFSLIIAMLIALVVPNILEKQGQRRAPKMRVAMVIALGIMIVGYFLKTGIQTGFKFA